MASMASKNVDLCQADTIDHNAGTNLRKVVLQAASGSGMKYRSAKKMHGGKLSKYEWKGGQSKKCTRPRKPSATQLPAATAHRSAKHRMSATWLAWERLTHHRGPATKLHAHIYTYIYMRGSGLLSGLEDSSYILNI